MYIISPRFVRNIKILSSVFDILPKSSFECVYVPASVCACVCVLTELLSYIGDNSIMEGILTFYLFFNLEAQSPSTL